MKLIDCNDNFTDEKEMEDNLIKTAMVRVWKKKEEEEREKKSY
jgi:hypothetical protein